MTDAAMTRRQLVVGITALAAAGGQAEAQRGDPQRPLVRIADGTLRGTTEQGVKVFRGIPFAAPPVGALRFRPPAPVQPWSGVREAAAFGNAPEQPPAPGGLSSLAFLGAETSEDCLYLNVWAPAAPGPHPVLVWIHGGGNMAGSASQGIDGSVFAAEGIVTVSVGYRLGAFGFLELGRALGASYRGSGVNALRDQIAALRWIRANIAAFGGDPARVTVCGVSAGAKNIVALMASPMAADLFSSAIVESGGQTIHDLCSADDVAAMIVERLRSRRLAASDLPHLPAADLNAVQVELLKDYGRPFPFRAVIGTDVLPTAPIEALRRASRPHRLLIGTNRDEAIVFLDRSKVGAPITQHDLANTEVAAVASVAAAYDRAFPSLDPLHRRVRLVSAEEYVVPSVRVADAVARGSPVWMYRFEQQAPSGPFAGWVPHGSEAMYVWNLFDQPLFAALFGKADAARRELGVEMRRRWSAFVRGGAPDASGAVSWPRYEGGAALVFAEGRSSAGAVDRQETALWDYVPFGAPELRECPRAA